MNAKTKTLSIVVAVALLALVLVLGFYLGKNQGASQTKSELKPLLDYAFPAPPTEIKTLNGTITGIYGATVYLQVQDPNDYLPHTDGTPRAVQTRYASVSNATAIKLIDYSKLSKQGLPQITNLKLTDLKVGDAITVKSAQNIKDAEKFDVTEIDLVKYP